jgi:hypothetical protein
VVNNCIFQGAEQKAKATSSADIAETQATAQPSNPQEEGKLNLILILDNFEIHCKFDNYFVFQRTGKVSIFARMSSLKCIC